MLLLCMVTHLAQKQYYTFSFTPSAYHQAFLYHSDWILYCQLDEVPVPCYLAEILCCITSSFLSHIRMVWGGSEDSSLWRNILLFSIKLENICSYCVKHHDHLKYGFVLRLMSHINPHCGQVKSEWVKWEQVYKPGNTLGARANRKNSRQSLIPPDTWICAKGSSTKPRGNFPSAHTNSRIYIKYHLKSIVEALPRSTKLGGRRLIK